MTHQEIANAFETIYERSHEIAEVERAWVDAERKRLQMACGTAGHIWGRSRWAASISLWCVVCGHSGPR